MTEMVFADILRTVPSDLRISIQDALLGGKQLRPRLLQAWHTAAGGSGPNWIGPAVAIELIHRASLVHDDLPCMDAGLERNGRPTVHASHGAAHAVLTGDAMIALAFRTIASATHSPEMTGVLAQTVLEMCVGQAREFKPTLAASKDSWEQCSDQKTGSLFAAACELGVMSAGESADSLRPKARSFGRQLGQLYQLADDIVDGDAYPLHVAQRSDSIWRRLEDDLEGIGYPDALTEFVSMIRRLVVTS